MGASQYVRKCVFIGGCPRSGTTMLGSALGMASGAVVTPESQFKLRMLERARLASGRVSAESLYAIAARDTKFMATWHHAPKVRVQTSSEDPMETARRVIFDMVDQYATGQGHPQWKCWIDHSPENLRRIRELLPLAEDLKFIHLVRDGRAVAASVLDLDWGPTDTLNAGKWWVQEVGHALAAELYVPGRVLHVHYEKLVSTPEPVLRSICDFVGLEFDPRMVNADALATPSYVKETHALVGSRIAPSQISAWRQKLSRRQIQLFEYEAGNLLEILGYERAALRAECRPTKTEIFFYKFDSPAWRLINKWRNRTRMERAIRDEGNRAGASSSR